MGLDARTTLLTEQHRVPSLRRDPLGPTDHVCEELVREVWNDEPDRVRAAPDQASRDDVGTVAKLLRRAQYALPGVRGDARRRILREHERDGRLGYAGAGGNVVRRDAPLSGRPWLDHVANTYWQRPVVKSFS